MSPWSGRTVDLMAQGTLGSSSTEADKVIAGLVPVASQGVVDGAYAWHVSDESTKARINLYRDPDQNGTLAQMRALLGGHRPDPSVLKGPDGNLLSFMPSDQDAAAFAAAKSNLSRGTTASS